MFYWGKTLTIVSILFMMVLFNTIFVNESFARGRNQYMAAQQPPPEKKDQYVGINSYKSNGHSRNNNHSKVNNLPPYRCVPRHVQMMANNVYSLNTAYPVVYTNYPSNYYSPPKVIIKNTNPYFNRTKQNPYFPR